jgi:hypothetical protein
MEDAMNPKFEFFTNQWKQNNSQRSPRMEKDENQSSEPGFRGKLFDLLGNAMISGGTWLKKSSKSQIDDQSVAI